ncbi:hypothetical protein BH09BAC1_BH09BAC1_28690 [soil metagenome]
MIYPAVVWNGMQFKWQKYPHRLSILGSRLSPKWSEDRRQLLSYEHELSLKIGNWPPENADYFVPFTRIMAHQGYIGTGQAVIQVSCPIEVGITQQETITVDLANLTAFTNVSEKGGTQGRVKVLLNGFRVQSENNVSGWHFGGLGIELSHAKILDGHQLQFDAEVFIRPARSPEPLSHGNRGWKFKKDPCGYFIHFDFLVIAGQKEDVHFTESKVEVHEETARKEYKALMKATMPGKDNQRYANAFSGITGFKFKLGKQDKALLPMRTGRYIRELGFYTENFKYSTHSGIGEIAMNLAFSNLGDNVSYLANKWKLETSVKLCMVQINGLEYLEHGSIKGTTAKNRQAMNDVKPIWEV